MLSVWDRRTQKNAFKGQSRGHVAVTNQLRLSFDHVCLIDYYQKIAAAMGYRNLNSCVTDLERNGQLVRLESEIDANLEAAEIQRRVYLSGGPAILFANVRDCRFPMVSNLFGTLERARFIFRDTFENVQRAIQLKVDPSQAMRQPLKYWRAPLIAWQMQPKFVGSGPVHR